ncbi:hypothetical protein [Phormidium sp. CCY1219]|uniref:hypothetical protein n=1 Tax=Phormidium sp. CCY1219 TaxID=2886104 RepID=UPI002D1F8FAB|nr:hypothetical protein [Phormidium sp. CCY1219]MEB3831792.1 hypothetical protein [Phormidium sp. CCY1219]
MVEGYQFQYPANYRLLLENDGSLFLTTEQIYQYLQCAVRGWVPPEDYPNGILIQWRTREQLAYLLHPYAAVVRIIDRQMISGRNATFYVYESAVCCPPMLYVTIPSRGGYVVISTNASANGIPTMEQAFFRVIMSIMVP